MKGLALGVVGATGLLGRELVELLAADRLPVRELRPFAGDRSIGEDVEFRDDVLPVRTDSGDLAGLDALVLCTPPGPALELVRMALRAGVPCVDGSGALLDSAEVPVAVAALGHRDDLARAPLVSSPPGPALVLAPVLAAIQREAGLRRVVGTLLRSASSGGRAGVERLAEDTLALLGAREPQPFEVTGGARAFDCHAEPLGADGGKDGATANERTVGTVLRRVLGADVSLALTSVHVPAFAGQGAALAIETDAPLTAERAVARLREVPGVRAGEDDIALGTRASVGAEQVVVSRLRGDPTLEPGRGLLLWLVGDPVRLAARNAVEILRARFAAGG